VGVAVGGVGGGTGSSEERKRRVNKMVSDGETGRHRRGSQNQLLEIEWALRRRI
jgi:hypothetical protein